jgi:hypothetical protein
MDVLNLGSMTSPEPADEIEESSSRHWLSELFRADVLAVSGAVLVIVTLLGTATFGEYVLPAIYGGQGSPALTYLPQSVSGAVAALTGIAGLRKAVLVGSPAWVRAVGGTAAIVGLLLALGFLTLFFVADATALLEFENF